MFNFNNTILGKDISEKIAKFTKSLINALWLLLFFAIQFIMGTVAMYLAYTPGDTNDYSIISASIWFWLSLTISVAIFIAWAIDEL